MSFLVILLRNLLVIALAPFIAGARLVAARKGPAPYVHIRLSHLTEARVAPKPLQRMPWISAPRVADLVSLSRLLSRVAKDPEVRGVVLHVSQLRSSWAAAGGLRKLLLKLRQEGNKEVIAFLPEGGGHMTLYLASACDRRIISPPASLTIAGFASPGLYLSELLARLGVVVQVNAQGAYKTAAESLVRSDMSEPQRQQLTTLLSARQRLLLDGLSPHLRPEVSPEQLLAEATLSPERAAEVGLVDGICYEDGLAESVGAAALGKAWAISAKRYRAWAPVVWWKPVRPRPYLAIVQLVGGIQHTGNSISRGSVIALEPTLARLRAVRRDPQVRGVLLRINSPGGSALVSDLIHHEVERLAAEKPTIAYFADVAASGGYYVATPARRILAAPETITGSIGVVSVKVSVGDALRRLGIQPQVASTAAHADMHSPLRPLDAAEEILLDRESRRIYQRFLEVVAKGRGKTVEDVLPLAGGRVWCAQDALERGLVDGICTFVEAIEELRQLVSPGSDRDTLPARSVRGRAVTVDTPEDPPGTAQGLLEALSLGPVADVFSLCAGAERVLCYCPGANVGAAGDCS